jgi:hypothetical protein
VSGYFRDTNDFDPHPVEEFWLTSSTVSSVFVATLDQSGFNPDMPRVEAGANQNILVTASAVLDGTVTDDGLPNPVTTTWSVYSGPGSVTFANASAIDTTATFSTSGEYWLQLEASDTQFTATDYVHIVVNPATVTLAATADTYLSAGGKTSNYGAASSLIADGNPDFGALFKWDLSSIPAGSTLQSATFSVNVTGTSADTYEIYELKRNWTELQATWTRAATGSNWQSAGAQGSLDRGSTVLGTVTATATGPSTFTLNAAGLAVVQGWVNNPATNFGFILQDYANTTKDDLVLSSKEVAIATNRPQLILAYNPPSASSGSAAAPSSKAGAGGAFALAFCPSSISGHPVSVAKFVDPDSSSASASQLRGTSLLLSTAQSRRLSSKATDNAFADLGHKKEDSANRDQLLDDELLLDIASASSLLLGF